MRVVYLNSLPAPARQTPEAVLALWPTLEHVPTALARAGLQVDVVQAAREAAVLCRDGVTFRFVPGGVRQVAEAVATCQPDIVHQQSFLFPRHTRAVQRRLPNVPVLVQDHGGEPPRGWRRMLAAWGARRIAGAAFTTREQAAPYLQRRILRPDTPVFEALESSTSFTEGDQAAAQAESGLHGDPCFLWVGRLDRNKDPLTVLGAFAAASREIPGAQLWMCYTAAPLLREVQGRLTSDPALARRVHLLGALPPHQLEARYRAADFFVLGSHREGSGYALLEALACGATPIVTDIPPFRRMTGRGRIGTLVRPGDGNAMAQAMVHWTRKNRAGLRQAARGHFEQALSFSVVASDLRAAYQAIAGAR